MRTALVAGILTAAACAGNQPAPKTVASPPAAVKPAGPDAGPPIVLVPAAAARPYLMAAVSVGSFDRLLSNGVKLVSSAVPIPMTAAQLRDMLLSEAGLPPEVAANVDLASPAGAAIVALDDKGRSGVVLAFPARGPAEAEKLIDALGKRVATRGPVTLIASSGKSQGWVYRADNVVVLSDEIDAMAKGAMLALEARRPSSDDATTTLYPEAIARSHGTDVKTAIAQFLEQMRQAQAAANPLAAPDSYVYEMFGKFLGLIGDADHAEIGLTVDPARGLILQARLSPRPGTSLEGVARELKPSVIEPAAFIGAGPPFAAGSTSIGPLWRQVFAQYRARLQASKDKGAAVALAYYDAFLAAMGDSQSGTATILKDAPYFTAAFVTPLKDAASAGKLAAAFGKMDVKAMDVLWKAQLSSSTQFIDWTAKRETVGKVKALHVKVTVKKGSLFDTDVMRRVFGKGVDFYQGVAGTRLIVTCGRDAKQRMAAIAGGKATAPALSPPLEAAAAGAKGRDAFYYLDFTPIIGVAASLESSPRLAAAARGASGPIPLIVTAGGDGAGKVWSVDLTLPASAFSSVGAIITAGALSGGLGQ